MADTLADHVRARASGRCEYCHMPQQYRRLRFQIDHIIASQHGGERTQSNLALACGHCNRHKGPNLSGIDPETRAVVRLFNPRQQEWTTHFALDGATIIGLTPIGRATVQTLAMNDEGELSVRAELIAQDLF